MSAPDTIRRRRGSASDLPLWKRGIEGDSSALRRGARLLLWCLTLAALGSLVDAQPVDSQIALTEGNRLFREGQIEAAVASYIEG